MMTNFMNQEKKSKCQKCEHSKGRWCICSCHAIHPQVVEDKVESGWENEAKSAISCLLKGAITPFEMIIFIRSLLSSKEEEVRKEVVGEIKAIYNKCKTEKGLSRALSNYLSELTKLK